MTTESLPPENSSTGRAHSAAISRMMVIASSSSSAVAWGVGATLGTGRDPTGAPVLSSGIGSIRPIPADSRTSTRVTWRA